MSILLFFFLFHLLKVENSARSDPVVRYGRHFCRTVNAVANVPSLITNGLQCLVEIAETSVEVLTEE